MKKLYIPQGIKEEAEIFDGFGKKELGQSIAVTLVGLLIAILIYFCTSNLVVCISTVMIAAAASIGIFTKVANISMFDRIVSILKYQKSQKYYPYSYLDEWNYGGDYTENDY